MLDGEILAWRHDSISEEGRALPFSSLQARLGRKRVTAEMRESVPVVFMAFDVLYAAGEMTMERPLKERRRVLEGLVDREQALTKVGSRLNSTGQQTELLFETAAEDNSFARLVLAPAVQLESVAQLEQAYVDARARGNEGVMLKARHSTYQPGRRGLAWLKLKRELATLDVVVTAAEYGHGRRAGWLSDYTFAVRDGDVLRNVGKAYSGVTDAEIAQLTQFFLEHTVQDYGSVRAVEPLVVFEVAFNNVMRSDRHDSGFALRFPRILRIRDDKPVSEIDTLERVAEIYQSQPDKPARPGIRRQPDGPPWERCSDPRSKSETWGTRRIFSDTLDRLGYISLFRRLVGMGVRVVVAGMVVFVDLDRRGATVGDFTFDTFELDGGVIDAELLPQRPVYLLQDAGAL